VQASETVERFAMSSRRPRVWAIRGPVLFGVAGASGAGMPAGGTVRILVVPGQNQGQGTIVLAGAIGDYGKPTKADKTGIGEMILTKGTIHVNLGAPIKNLNNSKPILETKTTCSIVFGATAPVKLLNGTGLHKGIDGTVMVTATFAAYGPFHKTGAHTGQCNTSKRHAPRRVGLRPGSGHRHVQLAGACSRRDRVDVCAPRASARTRRAPTLDPF
jgi:hypothetical protein